MKKRYLLSYLILCCLLYGVKAYSQDDIFPLRIMTYNIRHGAGMDDVIDLDRQANVIQGATPDVVGLQEVDSCVKRSGKIHQARVLANKLGMYATFGPAIPLTGGKYGVAILSKERPLSVRNIPLPGDEKRTLLVCEFQEYVFATTHLALEEENRLTSLDIIIEEAQRWEKPFFVCGDWNDTPSSSLITKMRKTFKFMNYLTSNTRNYTFRADNPTKIIDYIASFGSVVQSITSREVLKEPTASDHRPVVVEVKLKSLSTGITSPSEGRESMQDDEVYDLSGKRMPNGNLPKGIYILKNKKKLVSVK